MTSEEENRKRVDVAVDNLRRAEQAHRDKLVEVEIRLAAIEAQFSGMQQTAVNHTLMLESIRNEVVKLSRGLGVY